MCFISRGTLRVPQLYPSIIRALVLEQVLWFKVWPPIPAPPPWRPYTTAIPPQPPLPFQSVPGAGRSCHVTTHVITFIFTIQMACSIMSLFCGVSNQGNWTLSYLQTTLLVYSRAWTSQQAFSGLIRDLSYLTKQYVQEEVLSVLLVGKLLLKES